MTISKLLTCAEESLLQIFLKVGFHTYSPHSHSTLQQPTPFLSSPGFFVTKPFFIPSAYHFNREPSESPHKGVASSHLTGRPTFHMKRENHQNQNQAHGRRHIGIRSRQSSLLLSSLIFIHRYLGTTFFSRGWETELRFGLWLGRSREQSARTSSPLSTSSLCKEGWIYISIEEGWDHFLKLRRVWECEDFKIMLGFLRPLLTIGPIVPNPFIYYVNFSSLYSFIYSHPHHRHFEFWDLTLSLYTTCPVRGRLGFHNAMQINISSVPWSASASHITPALHLNLNYSAIRYDELHRIFIPVRARIQSPQALAHVIQSFFPQMEESCFQRRLVAIIISGISCDLDQEQGDQ